MIIPNIMFSPDYHGTNLKIQGLDSEYILILVDGYLSSLNSISVGSYNIADSKLIEEITI